MNNHRPHTKDYVLEFTLKEIKYDVKFDSWLKSKVANREEHNRNPKSEKVGYAYDDDRAEDWLIRQIDTAMNNVRGELAWCVADDERTDSDEILESPDKWWLHLHFSENWRGSARAIKSAVHAYITNYILAQWYRATMPRVADTYLRDANDCLTRAYNEARSEVVSYKPWNL